MKKIVTIMIIAVIVLSGLQAGALSKPETNKLNEIVKSISFSKPLIQESEEYVTLQLPETNHILRVSRKPEMPMCIYSLEIPFGAKNIKIDFTPSDEFEIDLIKKVKPTPQEVINVIGEGNSQKELIEDQQVYSSFDRYPATRYEVKITCGVKPNKNRITHISIYIYPFQYSPALNKIYAIKQAKLTITYDPPDKKMTFEEEYDLVIIAPSKFSNLLEELVVHKNSQNVKTFLKTTESIYNNYSGYDKPEQIKYFIKDAIETHNILYVLLVGGLKSYFYAKDRDDCNQGSKTWHVPVRYTNVETTIPRDEGALSDLYYSDIYEEGANFSSWDSNGDGIYARIDIYPTTVDDEIDFDPDVYVGRLPCRNKWEVKTVVKKIIQYETITPSTEPWYGRMVGISGLNHANYNDQPDGEYLTDLAFSYMENITDEEVRIYASYEDSGGPIPVTKYITKAFTNGARFIYFSGHGHPIKWTTHPADNINAWMQGIHIRNMWRFFNGKKLPIVVVGGCHDAQFNITWLNTYRARNETYDQWYWTHGDPGVHCVCWRMIMIPWGGAIASVGGTGLTTTHGDHPNTGNAKLATDFFYNIGKENATTFGEAFSKSIHTFVTEHPIKHWEAHVITIWNAIGDPSIQLL